MFKAEWAKENDFDEILEKADIIFGGEGNTDYFQLYHPKLYSVRNSATEHLVVREEDGIKGMLGVFPAEMSVCGRSLKVDGFGTMGVLKSARGKGYMKDLMNTAVEASAKRADLAFLGGRRQRYEYFGFTPSGVSAQFSFNSDNGKHSIGGADTSDIKFSKIDADDKIVLDFIESLTVSKAAYVKRDRNLLHAILHTCRNTPYLISKNDSPIGYVVAGGENRMICEIELKDLSLLPLVLTAYLKNFELRGVFVSGNFMFEREKLTALEAVCETCTLTGCESFLIHDFVKVLDAFFALKATYTKLYDGKTVFEINGRGRIAIEVKNGVHSVTKTTDDANVRISPIEATRLFFGITAHLDFDKGIDHGLAANFPLPLFYSRPDFV